MNSIEAFQSQEGVPHVARAPFAHSSNSRHFKYLLRSRISNICCDAEIGGDVPMARLYKILVWANIGMAIAIRCSN
ncbi:MAG TPA: hypothetical protein V6C78_24310 [Crinalium sp.]